MFVELNFINFVNVLMINGRKGGTERTTGRVVSRQLFLSHIKILWWSSTTSV